MSILKKISMRTIIITAVVSALVVALLICLLVIDELPRYKYIVTVPDTGSTLQVILEITNPAFGKTKILSLLQGDKDMDVFMPYDSAGRPNKDTVFDAGVLYFKIDRGSKTYLTYDAAVAKSGKHGNRGGVSSNYTVFDGEQALLLPINCYTYKPGSDRNILMREISFVFDLPDGWEQLTPRAPVENPRWADIYAITQDAFVFGKFNKIPNTAAGLDAFTLSDANSVSEETIDGFNRLYAYYEALFGSAPSRYSIVALPKPGGGAPQIIGGAGRGSVAASFDPDLMRDWQLLSHRMFHAFFDSVAPYASFHMPGNLWFFEGLATYYENMAMEALPDTLKTRLDIDVNRQMTLLFNNYLYMRIKDPRAFGFPPMHEEELTLDAQVEFLHYTAAPLIVKLLEDRARQKSGQRDAALRYCVNNSDSFDERFVSFEAALELLGEKEGQKFSEDYVVSIETPPLWNLKKYQPSDERIRAGLNEIEQVLGSWFRQVNEKYPIDIVSRERLQEAVESLNDRRVLFLSVETSLLLEDYCLPLYALLNDYYYTAKQKGIEFTDIELRTKMFADEDESGESDSE